METIARSIPDWALGQSVHCSRVQSRDTPPDAAYQFDHPLHSIKFYDQWSSRPRTTALWWGRVRRAGGSQWGGEGGCWMADW